MTDAQTALAQVREALADPALFDEGASVDDTFRAADNFGAACSPENIAAILAHVEAQAAENERLQVGIELIETENADLLTRLDLESGTVGMIARECADLRRQLDGCSQMLARQAAAIRERDELRRQLAEAERDSAMLDYVEQVFIDEGSGFELYPFGAVEDYADDGETVIGRKFLFGNAQGPTLRDAIYYAMGLTRPAGPRG